MDEAKTLVHMAISAMITAGILFLTLGVINMGYTIWNHFARQEDSSREMKSYISYTSYDNTVVRGQEIIQLIQKNEDIFVLLFDGVSGTSSEDLTLGNRCAVWALQGGYAERLNLPDITSTVNNTPTCARALNCMRRVTSLVTPTVTGMDCANLKGVDYGYLQSYLLYDWGYNGNYAKFRSCIVYDEYSSDIVGVLFVRVPEGVS